MPTQKPDEVGNSFRIALTISKRSLMRARGEPPYESVRTLTCGAGQLESGNRVECTNVWTDELGKEVSALSSISDGPRSLTSRDAPMAGVKLHPIEARLLHHPRRRKKLPDDPLNVLDRHGFRSLPHDLAERGR